MSQHAEFRLINHGISPLTAVAPHRVPRQQHASSGCFGYWLAGSSLRAMRPGNRTSQKGASTWRSQNVTYVTNLCTVGDTTINVVVREIHGYQHYVHRYNPRRNPCPRSIMPCFNTCDSVSEGIIERIGTQQSNDPRVLKHLADPGSEVRDIQMNTSVLSRW